MSEGDIVEEARRAAACVHIAVEPIVAEDLARILRKAADEVERLRRKTDIKEWDGRSVGDSNPHAAYCDIAMQDAMVQISDRGELIWSYDDVLFDKSLAGNGYKIMPMAAPAAADGMREALEQILAIAPPSIHASWGTVEKIARAALAAADAGEEGGGE